MGSDVRGRTRCGRHLAQAGGSGGGGAAAAISTAAATAARPVISADGHGVLGHEVTRKSTRGQDGQLLC